MRALEHTKLALHGGAKAVTSEEGDMFTWPIITREDEEAVLEVLRRGAMSDMDVTREFEERYAKWQGSRYALGFCNGTAALQAAMFACKIGCGDEVIGQSPVYWAAILPCYSLGATPVFADIDPVTLCIDPNDIEHRITSRTKAIVVVHNLGHPADMDEILKVARKHNLLVIEDVSHAQGGLYKGRKLGTLGDISAASLMTGKSLVAGEAGMLTTDNQEMYDRAVAWGHHAMFRADTSTEYLRPYAGLPMGGVKGRVNQLASALGLVQLKYYDQRCAEIRKAMNYFWDLLEGVPGIRAHRVDESSGSNMAGWYAARGHYVPEELGGLPVTVFTRAVTAEGSPTTPGINRPLHLHPMLNELDIYQQGKPTRIANSTRDLRQKLGSLPVSEGIGMRTFSIPWFKHYRPEIIEQHALAFRKVAEQYEQLLGEDPGDLNDVGNWGLSQIRQTRKAPTDRLTIQM